MAPLATTSATAPFAIARLATLRLAIARLATAPLRRGRGSAERA
jgi:hypothetical protein